MEIVKAQPVSRARSSSGSRGHCRRCGGCALRAACVRLGTRGAVAPSNRIIYGYIGCGPHGVDWNFEQIYRYADAQIIAVCDVDEVRLAAAKAKVDGQLQQAVRQGLQGLHGLRRFPRPDPPPGHRRGGHRHARPLARDSADHGRQGRQGRDLREAADADGGRGPHPLRRGRADRPDFPNRFGKPLDRHAISGWSSWSAAGRSASSGTSRCGCRSATTASASAMPRKGSSTTHQPTEPPKTLNYEMWLGQAPWMPYIPARTPRQFPLEPGLFRRRDLPIGAPT